MAGGAARKLGALRNEGETDGERMLGAGANEGELRGDGDERRTGAGAARGVAGAAVRGAAAVGAAVRGAAAAEGDAVEGTERAILRGRTSGRGCAPAGALCVCVVPSERVVRSRACEVGAIWRGVRDAVLVGLRSGCAGLAPGRTRDAVFRFDAATARGSAAVRWLGMALAGTRACDGAGPRAMVPRVGT